MNPQIDDEDIAIMNQRVAKRNERQGPRIGDFVRLLDGTLRRFTHDWDDTIQTTTKGDKYGSSFYLGANGGMDFSGGLDRAISKEFLELTAEEKFGAVWFFHHDQHTAHNGVHMLVLCRVYRQIVIDVCLAGNPAINGVCGDSDCVCALS